jgi:hypothetical protein
VKVSPSRHRPRRERCAASIDWCRRLHSPSGPRPALLTVWRWMGQGCMTFRVHSLEREVPARVGHINGVPIRRNVACALGPVRRCVAGAFAMRRGGHGPGSAATARRPSVAATRLSASFRHCDDIAAQVFAAAPGRLHSANLNRRRRGSTDESRFALCHAAHAREPAVPASDAPCISMALDPFPMAFRLAGWRDRRCRFRRSSESARRRLPR